MQGSIREEGKMLHEGAHGTRGGSKVLVETVESWRSTAACAPSPSPRKKFMAVRWDFMRSVPRNCFMRSSSLILWARRVTRVHLPAIDYDMSPSIASWTCESRVSLSCNLRLMKNWKTRMTHVVTRLDYSSCFADFEAPKFLMPGMSLTLYMVRVLCVVCCLFFKACNVAE